MAKLHSEATSHSNQYPVPDRMKAWVLGGPEELSVVEKQVPEPGPTEVLVRVDAIAVCATDIEIIRHGIPAMIDGGLPFNRGLEGMYTSCLNYGYRAKGHRANGFSTDGGFAEYAVNNINTLAHIPDDMSDAEATLVVTAGTAMYGLDVMGGVIAGEGVAIIGPGPIGLMGGGVAKALG